MSEMTMTVAEFAEAYLKPATHRLLLRIAKERGFSGADTKALIARFEADPIQVSDELFRPSPQ